MLPAAPRVTRPRITVLMVAIVLGLPIAGGLVYGFAPASWGADEIAARIRASGPLGPVALVALLVLQAVVAPLPSPPILMAGGFVYGPWIGFAIGWFGLLLGACMCFGLARWLGRPFVQRFVRPEQLAAMDQYVGTKPGTTFLGVLSLRLFLPPLFDPVSYGCGLLRLPFHWFVGATALGELPKVGSFTYLGAAAGSGPTWFTAWIILGPVAGVLLLRRVLRGRSALH